MDEILLRTPCKLRRQTARSRPQMSDADYYMTMYDELNESEPNVMCWLYDTTIDQEKQRLMPTIPFSLIELEHGWLYIPVYKAREICVNKLREYAILRKTNLFLKSYL
jgi:hypothetical protein